MSYWETSSTLTAAVEPAAIWAAAYADVSAWPLWNAEIKRAQLDRKLGPGAEAKVAFRSGLRLRFRVVEFEDGHLFTDEARLPGARMGHRHVVEPDAAGGSRLTNTIYIDGPLAGVWRRILGPPATRALPTGQRAAAELAGGRDEDLAAPA